MCLLVRCECSPEVVFGEEGAGERRRADAHCFEQGDGIEGTDEVFVPCAAFETGVVAVSVERLVSEWRKEREALRTH